MITVQTCSNLSHQLLYSSFRNAMWDGNMMSHKFVWPSEGRHSHIQQQISPEPVQITHRTQTRLRPRVQAYVMVVWLIIGLNQCCCVGIGKPVKTVDQIRVHDWAQNDLSWNLKKKGKLIIYIMLFAWNAKEQTTWTQLEWVFILKENTPNLEKVFFLRFSGWVHAVCRWFTCIHAEGMLSSKTAQLSPVCLTWCSSVVQNMLVCHCCRSETMWKLLWLLCTTSPPHNHLKYVTQSAFLFIVVTTEVLYS